MTIKKIEIHPGHWNATNSGASGILNEVTEARKVARRVTAILQSANVPVTYFEDNGSTNQTQNINWLVNEHNKDQDGLVVSIHFNSIGKKQDRAIGTEVLYFDQQQLAAKVSKAISEATNGELLNRGAKQRKELGVLARTYEPAILIEVCFVDSTIDVAVYRRDFENICLAIAKELASHIGYTINLPVQEEEEKSMTLLNETGRQEIRELLKKARMKTYLLNGVEVPIINPTIHTDAKINAYTDQQLLSYQAAIINRLF